MGGSGTLYSVYTVLGIIRAASASSIWHVSIDESPAPPPSEGPPFSAHASRNPALIPYQVIGICGAYLAAVLLTGTLLSTVGRSKRRRALRRAQEPMEMVKPIQNTFEQSPVSPGAATFGPGKHWRRLREMKSTSGSSMRSNGEEISPSVNSVASFDTSVIEADRRKRQLEMERLYAAVLAQDEARNPDTPMDEELPVGASYYATDMPPEYSRKQPPRLATPATNWRPPPPAPQEEVQRSENVTPKSPVRAIYPPDKELPPGPSSATSPIKAEYHQQPMPTAQQPEQQRSTHSRGLSSGSTNANTTKTTATGKLRKSLRNIKISSPLPLEDENNSDNDRTPLSPRYYTDPGPPPEPPTPGTSRSAAFPAGVSGPYAVRDVPQTAPQRQSAHQYQNPAQQITDFQQQQQQQQHIPRNPTPQRSNPHSLPLRELNRQYAAQQQQTQTHQQHPQTARLPTFPLSPGHWNPLSPSQAYTYATSAGPVKTTFLEARRDNFSQGPRTGVPTPYSPYMPFTPLTPVTPHLTSRAERKQREKEERRARRPIVEEEMVRSEKDVWGDGY